MGTLHKDLQTFCKLICRILLRMSNVSDKSCKQNQNTYLCSVNFFLKIVSIKEYAANKVQLDGPQMITSNSTEKMQDARARSHTHARTRTRTHTHTHIYSMYVIRMAFQWQHWLHKCASVLHHTYITCLVWHIARSGIHSTGLWPMLMTSTTCSCTQYGLESCFTFKIFDSST